MKQKRNAVTKARIAIEAIKEAMTLAELCSKFGVHRTQISRFKADALAYIASGFKGEVEVLKHEQDELIDNLYKQVGRLNMENEWLKKKCEQFGFTDKKKYGRSKGSDV